MTQGQSVCSRIRNARASLDNAERSFRSNQDVRGELDLMLAEAELENLRRKRGRISWTRHMLALCLSVLVLAAGGLGWWWASAYGGKTSNAAPLHTVPTVVEKQEPADIKSSVVAGKNLDTQNSRESQTGSGTAAVLKQDRTAVPGIREPGSVGGSIQLSSGQMRQLIRSGKQELGSFR